MREHEEQTNSTSPADDRSDRDAVDTGGLTRLQRVAGNKAVAELIRTQRSISRRPYDLYGSAVHDLLTRTGQPSLGEALPIRSEPVVGGHPWANSTDSYTATHNSDPIDRFVQRAGAAPFRGFIGTEVPRDANAPGKYGARGLAHDSGLSIGRPPFLVQRTRAAAALPRLSGLNVRALQRSSYHAGIVQRQDAPTPIKSGVEISIPIAEKKVLMGKVSGTLKFSLGGQSAGTGSNVTFAQPKINVGKPNEIAAVKGEAQQVVDGFTFKEGFEAGNRTVALKMGIDSPAIPGIGAASFSVTPFKHTPGFATEDLKPKTEFMVATATLPLVDIKVPLTTDGKRTGNFITLRCAIEISFSPDPAAIMERLGVEMLKDQPAVMGVGLGEILVVGSVVLGAVLMTLDILDQDRREQMRRQVEGQTINILSSEGYFLNSLTGRAYGAIANDAQRAALKEANRVRQMMEGKVPAGPIGLDALMRMDDFPGDKLAYSERALLKLHQQWSAKLDAWANAHKWRSMFGFRVIEDKQNVAHWIENMVASGRYGGSTVNLPRGWWKT